VSVLSLIVVRKILRDLGIILNFSTTELEEEFEEFLFEKLKEVYSIIGSVNECEELEKVVYEKMIDLEERERLREYIKYLIRRFLEYRTRRKKLEEIYT